MRRTEHKVKCANGFRSSWSQGPLIFYAPTPVPPTISFYSFSCHFFSESVMLPVLAWSSLGHCFNFTGLQLFAKHYSFSMKSLPGPSLFLFFNLNAEISVKLFVNSIRGSERSPGNKLQAALFQQSLLIAFSTLENCQLQLTVLRGHVQKSNARAAENVTVKKYTISSHWEK